MTGALIALGIFIAGIIYKLIALHVGHSELCKEVEAMATRHEEMRKDVDRHGYDSLRHIDPVRDTIREKAWERRMDRIEQKLDALLAVMPTRGRRNKGSDEDDDH